MKERPIIMRAESVRAILAYTKTQTRQIVRRRDGYKRGDIPVDFLDGMFWFTDGDAFAIDCPAGKAGDRLWVRESFYCDHCLYPTGPREEMRKDLYYRADVTSGRFQDADEWGEPGSHWRPPVHMPRWASRSTLEIMDVRVGRVQDISIDDARAEGIPEYIHGWKLDSSEHEADVWRNRSSAENFAANWDDINGKGAWDRNDLVWALTFKRV